MNSSSEPRDIVKEQYAVVRRSLTDLDERVAARYWNEDAPIRVGFRRFLESLDKFAGWGPAEDESESSGPSEQATATVADTVDVLFTLPADVQAERVVLCGEFNQWSPDGIPLERAEDGTWRAIVALAPGRSYRYRYLLDGERWENAREADDYVPNPYGTVDSVIRVVP